MANKPAGIIDRPFQVRNKNFVRNRAKLKMVACRNCGRNHEVRKCPAYDKECHKCHKKNHFAKMCRSGQKQNKEVTLIEAEDYVIESIQIHENTTPNEAEALVILTILEEKVLVKLDTGAEVNVMRI